MKKLNIKKEGILLKKTDYSFESEGVLNPAVIKDNKIIHLFYRAVAKGNFSSIGYCQLSDPMHIKKRKDVPVLIPEYDYEKQ